MENAAVTGADVTPCLSKGWPHAAPLFQSWDRHFFTFVLFKLGGNLPRTGYFRVWELFRGQFSKLRHQVPDLSFELRKRGSRFAQFSATAHCFETDHAIERFPNSKRADRTFQRMRCPA